MKLTFYSYATAILLLLNACNAKEKKTATTNLNKISNDIHKNADKIINNAITTHGGELYKKAKFSFDFRGKNYQFNHQNKDFKYKVTSERQGNKITDILKNDTFTRLINDSLVTLSANDRKRFSASLNSVIYFALLPYKLNDTAVIKEYEGTVSIFNESYHTVKVTFKQDGGGEDYQDVFYYWIHKAKNTVDFIAYKYHVNGGGIRFRKAYNRRKVEGIIFQDYINYSAPFDSSLQNLPKLFENNQLKEVSKITMTNIIAVK